MIIDAYAHGFHGKYLGQLEAAGGGWAKETLAKLLTVTRNKPSLTDVALRMEMLERNGIDVQVVTPSHFLDSNLLPGDNAAQVAMARAINDNMARIMEDSKGRLLALGSVSLAAFQSGGEQEMERAIKGLGLKGIKLPSHCLGKPPDLPEFEPFWARAAEMNVPVYIQPVDPMSHTGRAYERDYGLSHTFGWPFETVLIMSRLVFSGIMERYPTLKVMSHHLGGGMIPFLWGRIIETYAPDNQQSNLQSMIGQTLSKPLFDYFSRFYYDTAVGASEPAIKCAYEVFGVDQIVFATDFPFGPGTGEMRLASYPNVIRSLGFSEADNKKIFEDNIRRVLNLDGK